MLLLNLLLALAWVALTGQLTPINFGFGLVVGYLLLWLARRPAGESNYFRKLWQVVRFAGFFIWQLVLANLRVTYEILTPAHTMRPAVVAVPLDVTRPAAVTLLAKAGGTGTGGSAWSQAKSFASSTQLRATTASVEC